jgi:NADPH:quinone reductase-like Zn-dependent oxidoreductase
MDPAGRRVLRAADGPDTDTMTAVQLETAVSAWHGSAPHERGELSVRVELPGVNWWEVMLRAGQVPIGPSRLPGRGVGRVVTAGPGADAAMVGRVARVGRGGVF